MSDQMMTNPNRLTYDSDVATVKYCAASEGRGEGASYVPDIWHAVEILASGPADVGACGAHYEAEHLDADAAFETKPQNQKCGGCHSRVGAPLSFQRG